MQRTLRVVDRLGTQSEWNCQTREAVFESLCKRRQLMSRSVHSSPVSWSAYGSLALETDNKFGAPGTNSAPPNAAGCT